MLMFYRSENFRPVYDRLHEIRAIVPSGVPLIAATATVTVAMREEVIMKLDMIGCDIVCVSPNRPNTYYEVRNSSTICKDMAHLVETLRIYGPLAKRVIVYCRSLDMCADLYEHFLCSLGVSSYHPVGAEQVCSNDGCYILVNLHFDVCRSVLIVSLECFTLVHRFIIRTLL